MNLSEIWSLIADIFGVLISFLVKDVSSRCSEERTKRCLSDCPYEAKLQQLQKNL